jgi:hypothetical protein
MEQIQSMNADEEHFRLEETNTKLCGIAAESELILTYLHSGN